MTEQKSLDIGELLDTVLKVIIIAGITILAYLGIKKYVEMKKKQEEEENAKKKETT